MGGSRDEFRAANMSMSGQQPRTRVSAGGQTVNRYGRLTAAVYNVDKPVGRSLGDVEFLRVRLREWDGSVLEPPVGAGFGYA